MKALLASAEAVPFAKVGGLADVVGSLPMALRALGIDARVIMPGYGFIDHLQHDIRPLLTFDFPHRLGINEVALYACVCQDVPFYLLQSPPWFGAEGAVYSHPSWDMERFVYLNQALMAALHWLDQALGWFPDLLHVNDWHTGLLPFMIREYGQGAPWTRLATLLSIHNIAYQGDQAGGFLFQAGINGRHDPALLQYGLTDNLLAIGIASSDKITTVSPRYADEIQHAYAGGDLAGLIRERAADLRGILNGVDTAAWDPAVDPSLISRFDAGNFVTKRPPNKRHLQSLAGLPIDPDIPLVGVVSRLAAQKGFDLALPALRDILGARNLQLVALGSGESNLEYGFWRLEGDFPAQARAWLQFDAELARQIYAGCDIFLMPSHFEPCGMGQMLAMRYGALPLVRETGGLADTVVNYDNADADAGTGFVFAWQQAQAVAGTLIWALDLYQQERPVWQRMQERAMSQDFSWSKSAAQYRDLYQLAIAERRGKRTES